MMKTNLPNSPHIEKLETKGIVLLDPSTDVSLLNSPHILSSKYPVSRCTILFEAASTGDLELCRFLLKYCPQIDTQAPNSWGCTPLGAACDNGHLEVAKWLVASGSAGDELYRSGIHARWPPLQLACVQGHLRVVRWLLEQQPFVQLPAQEWCVRSMIYSAHRKVATWLILHGAANTNRGHVDEMIFRHRWLTMGDADAKELADSFLSIVNDQHTFVHLFMSSVVSEASTLRIFHGFEESICITIAEFVGVAHGRRLRNAREALVASENVIKSKKKEVYSADIRLCVAVLGAMTFCIITIKNYLLVVFIASLTLMGLGSLVLAALLTAEYYRWGFVFPHPLGFSFGWM